MLITECLVPGILVIYQLLITPLAGQAPHIQQDKTKSIYTQQKMSE